MDAAFENWRAMMTMLAGRRVHCDTATAQDVNVGKDTPDEENISQKAARERQEQRDARNCVRWRDSVLKGSPIVKFMIDHVVRIKDPEGVASPVHDENGTRYPIPVKCVPCGPTMSGGFSAKDGVLLCENRVTNEPHLEDTLAHELVHAYDIRRFRDPSGRPFAHDLRVHACTEIRASALSGECRWTRELRRGYIDFSKHHQACVRRRAALSVAANPHCASQDDAERIVDSVFRSCYADTRPFDEIY